MDHRDALYFWLLLLNITICGFIHIVACGRFFLIPVYCSNVRMNIPKFTYLFPVFGYYEYIARDHSATFFASQLHKHDAWS